VRTALLEVVITSQVYEKRPGSPTMNGGASPVGEIDCAGFGYDCIRRPRPNGYSTHGKISG
jgi:hypothetical protein